MQPIPYPAELRPILQDLPQSYLVGGCVRDHLLGLKPKDFDIEVYNNSYPALQQYLEKYGKVDLVGKAFGVIKLTLPSGDIYDFSLARRDSKIENGVGHKAFTVDTSKGLTVREGCARRDLTINSMAYDPRTHELVDPYNGHADLQNKLLRHTSDQFAEDPLRVLRIMQFAGRFDFAVAPETVELCRSMQDQFSTLPKERVGEEFYKLLTKGVNIKRGLEFLAECGWVKHFPELQAQIGVPQQPEWHPEGTVDQHVYHCCNALAQMPTWQAMPERERYVYMLGILCHDLGKPSCTKEEFKPKLNQVAIVSPGHDLAGEEPTRSFLSKLNVPHDIVRRVVPLVTCHMDHLQVKTDEQIRRLAVKVSPEGIQGLGLIVEADHSGRPPLPKQMPLEMVHITMRARELSCILNRPQPVLQGRHIGKWTTLPPGKAYGVLCDAAYEAQLKGTIQDEPTALAWLRQNRGRVLENAKLAPARFVSGQELVALYGGKPTPDMGKLHRELFELQLDGVIPSKAAAWEFIKTNGQKYGVKPEATSDISLILQRAVRKITMAGTELVSPDPVAQDILKSSDFLKLNTFCQDIPLTGKVLGAGVGSIVLETGRKTALRIGLGPLATRATTSDMLPAVGHQLGSIRVEESEIAQPILDRTLLDQLRSRLLRQGYHVTSEIDLDNIGQLPSGKVVVTDPGALLPKIQEI